MTPFKRWTIERSEQEGTREGWNGRLYTANRVEWHVIDECGRLRDTFKLKREARHYIDYMTRGGVR